MPDFDARFTSGTTLATWRDPLLGSRPSRINPVPRHPLRYQVAMVDSQIEITATVGGAEAPLDDALDGRLFLGWLAEYPSGPKPSITSPPGQSSVRSFTPSAFGHYTYVLRRKGGGGLIFHVDVVGS